jgi:outer membrane immunogenic protein
VCASSAAFAADLPTTTKAPPPIVQGWTGFYAGANVGYGWQDPTAVFSPADFFSAALINNVGTNFTPLQPPTSFDIAGATGGFQAGYNWQVDQRWLVGAETDFNFSGLTGHGATNFIVAPGNLNVPFSALASEQVKWFGTVRARAGYFATPDLLVFATGGLAYGKVEHNASMFNNGLGFTIIGPGGVGGGGVVCAGNTNCYAGSSSRIAAGWTAGGGLEYAIGRNWTVKAEYLYVNLGSDSFAAPAVSTTVPGGSRVNVSYSDTTFNLVRIGANYRF